MKLVAFRIRAFKCIRDTGIVPVKNITAFVGTNESGKTAILEALLYLNKGATVVETDICDEIQNEVIPGYELVRGTFELLDDEKESLHKEFLDAPALDTVDIVRKKGDLEPTYEFPGVSLPEIRRLDAVKWKAAEPALRQLVARVTQLSDSMSDEPAKTSLEQWIVGYSAAIGAAPPSRDAVSASITSLELLTKDEGALGARKAALVAIADCFPAQKLAELVPAFIRSKLHPRFVLFTEYRKIFGAIHLKEFLGGPQSTADRLESGERLDKRETVENLFYLANLDPKELEANKAKPGIKERYLRNCAQTLTRALERTWLTQRVIVDLRYDGDVFTVLIEDVNPDGSHTNFGLLSRRSEGFRWHFSFFVNFTAETQRASLKAAILLLDEPGLHLHPAQQRGLIALIQDLAKTNQVLYTTHSPYLLFDYEVGSLLTVERDPSTHQTKITPRYWAATPETAMPILHSLGAESIVELAGINVGSVSDPVVIVEGPTDYMYYLVLSRILRDRNMSGLGDIDLVPAQGSPQVGPLAQFHLNRGYRVAVLYDLEPDSKKLADDLVKDGFPADRIRFVEATGRPEADVEDLFPRNLYLKAVNDLYETTLRDRKYAPVTRQVVDSVQGTAGIARMVPTLEALWRSNEAKGWGHFDKSKVCVHLCNMLLEDPSAIPAKALEPIERLFTELHAATQAGPSGGPLPRVDDDLGFEPKSERVRAGTRTSPSTPLVAAGAPSTTGK
jgi:hypothetical protein